MATQHKADRGTNGRQHPVKLTAYCRPLRTLRTLADSIDCMDSSVWVIATEESKGTIDSEDTCAGENLPAVSIRCERLFLRTRAPTATRLLAPRYHLAFEV